MGSVNHEEEPQAGLFTAKIIAPLEDMPIYRSLAVRVNALGLDSAMNIAEQPSTEDGNSRMGTMLITGTSNPLDVFRRALNVRQEHIKAGMRDLALTAVMDTFFEAQKLRFPDIEQVA